MAKRATATNWEVVVKDDEGAMVNIDFNCPYCGYSTGVLISVGSGSLSCLEGSWETDQTCPVCDRAVVVECH